MSIVPDELLLEIWLRLPNARSLLRCTGVCKRWYSLILSPEFSLSERFIQYHHLLKPSSDSAFDFLFKFSASESDPFYQLSSNLKLTLKPRPSFVSTSARLAIRASSGDLMLLSIGEMRYYICSSVTNCWFRLPEIPHLEEFILFLSSSATRAPPPAFALVRYPSNTSPQLLGRYRVVVMCWARMYGRYFQCAVAIFNSDTGLWTFSQPRIPYTSRRHYTYNDIVPDFVIASNGVLYWMEGAEHDYLGIASLDPSTEELRVIPLPACQFEGFRSIDFKHKVQTGVVRGRVRVSRMVEFESKGRLGLRVWELDCEDDTWELVHDIELQAAGASFLFLLAFDPNDGDAIFVVRDWEIFRYEIGQQKFIKICSFPRDGILSVTELKEKICRYLKVLTLVHPLWPTSMPSGSE